MFICNYCDIDLFFWYVKCRYFLLVKNNIFLKVYIDLIKKFLLLNILK